MKMKLKPLLTETVTDQEMKIDTETIRAHHKDKKINQNQTSSTKTMSKTQRTPCDCNNTQLTCLVCASIYHFAQNCSVTEKTRHKIKNLLSETRNSVIPLVKQQRLVLENHE